MKSRITELEIKLSLEEDHLEEINRTVFRQQQQIDRLQAQISEGGFKSEVQRVDDDA